MPPERKSIEMTLFDENGVCISYDRDRRVLIIEGWFNYIQQMDKFEIPFDEFLKELIIPIEDVRTAYGIDYLGEKVTNPKKKKAKCKYNYKRKTPELFKYHRVEKRPTYDIVCKWKDCGKTFTTTDKKRKYCSKECVNAWFKWQVSTGESARKAVATRARRKEINKKISDSMRNKK